MKYVIILILIASFGSIFYGFTIKEDAIIFANKCIGFGTAGIFLLAMPLFLIKASKGKDVKNYMLTEENIRKMQGKKSETPKNQ